MQVQGMWGGQGDGVQSPESGMRQKRTLEPTELPPVR